MADKKLTEADRLKLVDHIVENSHGVWTEEDREVLSKMEDVPLYKIAVQNADPEEGEEEEGDAGGADSDAGGEDAGGGDAGDAGEGGETTNAHGKKKKGKMMMDYDEEDEEEEEEVENRRRPMTRAEWMRLAPVEVRNELNDAHAIVQEKKDEIVANMTSHVDDAETKQELVKTLNAKPLSELKKLVALTASKTTQTTNSSSPLADYRGASVPNTTNSRPKVDPKGGLPLPTYNWQEISTENAKQNK